MTTDSTGKVRDRSLKGKVAIVTGAGCAGEGIGNGRAEAILLAEDGCTVVCVDLNEEWAAKTASMINNEGHGSAYVCVADVSKAEACEKVVETAVSKFGRLDILVNNVGIPGPSGNVVEVDIDGWKSAMDVNLTSVILMSKYAIPYMKKNQGEEKGSIITLSSIAGMGGSIPHIFYAVSKGAMYTLTKTMALHHGKEGIRVNCIVPGTVWTPLVHANPNFEVPKSLRQSRIDGNMLATEGTGWDTGYAVRWLSSPEARWITGVVLPVDAGLAAMVAVSTPTYEK